MRPAKPRHCECDGEVEAACEPGDPARIRAAREHAGNPEHQHEKRTEVDRDAEHPVRARLDVQGNMESGDSRMSGNVYAMLPGQSGDYVLIPSHVDGYFNAIHDNGAGVAINLALAEYFLGKPAAERRHGLIFLFQGDHEVPGAGGTVVFARKHEQLMREHLLLVLQPEHPTSRAHVEESGVLAWSNSSNPLMLFVTNRSPALIDVFKRAITLYNIPTADRLLVDPPRTGLSRKVREGLTSLRPERLTYVSCDPPTLARDLRQLTDVYRIESWALLDLFPQTGHMEAVVQLVATG